MKNIENYTRALQHLTVKGTKEIERLASEISVLLHLGEARVEATTCHGKWRRTFDYSLVFDSGYLHLQNISNHHSKRERTGWIIEVLSDAKQKYENLFANATTVFEALLEREKADNALAAEKGLKPYTLKRFGIETSGLCCGWSYLVLDIGGVERLHITTDLNYDIFDCNLDRLRKQSKQYHPAANYKEKEIDFIQGGVGFVANAKGYTVESEGITVMTREDFKIKVA